MKIQWNGLCPHCKKQIELVRELPNEIIRQIIEQATKKPSEPETKAIPHEKDESPVTNEDIANLKKLMERAAMGAVELGKMMVNSPLNWKNIQKYTDLKKWQYNELVDILKKAVG